MDNVRHPPHYGGQDNPYETIKVIEAWGLGFHLGNAVKYLSRAGKKTSTSAVEDLEKAVWYINREITRVRKESHEPVEGSAAPVQPHQQSQVGTVADHAKGEPGLPIPQPGHDSSGTIPMPHRQEARGYLSGETIYPRGWGVTPGYVQPETPREHCTNPTHPTDPHACGGPIHGEGY